MPRTGSRPRNAAEADPWEHRGRRVTVPLRRLDPGQLADHDHRPGALDLDQHRAEYRVEGLVEAVDRSACAAAAEVTVPRRRTDGARLVPPFTAAANAARTLVRPALCFRRGSVEARAVGDFQVTRRRSQKITEAGHEIALPTRHPAAAAQPDAGGWAGARQGAARRPLQRRRRRARGEAARWRVGATEVYRPTAEVQRRSHQVDGPGPVRQLF